MDDKVLSREQVEKLQEHIRNDDRTGFYASLAEMTGSKIAIDMAQTSSFSGFQGAGALYSKNLALILTSNLQKRLMHDMHRC